MLLAQDSIIGIFIPSSISLQVSLFTHTVRHHLATNSLVTFLASFLWCVLPRGPRDTLWYMEWQIPISIHANSTDTFGDTRRASLWSPSYVVTFDSTQGIPPVSESCMISWSKKHVFDIKKAIAIAINWTIIFYANGLVLSITSIS